MVFKKFFYFCITLVFLNLECIPAQARIPTIAFKGVTKYFKEGQEFYSPTFGIIAIESGLIHNLRFFGDFTPRFKEDLWGNIPSLRTRVYHEDSSQDPLWNLVFTFFPDYAVETQSPHNLGKHITSPKTMAWILNYAYQIRRNAQYHFPAFHGQDPLPSSPARTREIPGDSNPPHIQTASKIFLNNQNLLVKAIFESLNITEDSYAGNLKKNIKKLLSFINKSIAQEKEPQAFYPLYTTEQIILAFFCEKFNSQKDIWRLIKDLEALDIEKTMIQNADALNPEQEDLFSKEDLLSLTHAPSTIDEMYFLANSDIFQRFTPYKPGIRPLSNGNTYAYDRVHNTVQEKKKFPDCIEIVMRHLSNLILYNPHNQAFDLDFLENHLTHMKDSTISTYVHKYFQNFKEFYAHQSPALANSGTIEIRSLWNRVVGDLNSLHQGTSLPRILYKQNNPDYNMVPGFINVIHAFSKILGIHPMPAFPESLLRKQQKWVEESFKTIFTILNPNRSYRLETQDLELKAGFYGQKEMLGKLKATVKEKEKPLFSFTVDMKTTHGNLSHIFEKKNFTPTKKDPDFEQLLKKGTMARSLLLLLDDGGSPTQNLPLYDLYPCLLQDNKSYIKTLEAMVWHKESPLKPHLSIILNHILDNLSWNDVWVLRRATPFLLKLAPQFPEVTNNHVKALKIKRSELLPESVCLSDPLPLTHPLKNFTSLEKLIFSDLQNIYAVSFQNFPHLKTLKISHSPLTTLKDLELCTALENLAATAMENLETFPFQTLTHLRKLDLSSSRIKNFTDFHGYILLEDLNLSNITTLQTLCLKGLTRLKRVTLNNSKIQELTDLESCHALETFSAFSTRDLKHLTLRGLTNLKTLLLSEQTLTSYPHLEDCGALRMFYISQNMNIETLCLKGLSSLKTLEISGSSIKTLENLEDCTNLISIRAYNTLHLKTLCFKGLTSLKKVDLSRSNIEALEDMEDCKALEELILFKTKNIKSVSVKHLPSLKHLDTFQSGIVQNHLLDMD